MQLISLTVKKNYTIPKIHFAFDLINRLLIINEFCCSNKLLSIIIWRNMSILFPLLCEIFFFREAPLLLQVKDMPNESSIEQKRPKRKLPNTLDSLHVLIFKDCTFLCTFLLLYYRDKCHGFTLQ